MPRFVKRPWFWILIGLIAILGIGFVVMSGQARAKREETARAAAQAPESPYAAIANGKADVEGGVIQVAARRGGVVDEVLVQEGQRVTAGQVLARQESDEFQLAVQRAGAEVRQAQSQTALTRVDIAAAERELARLQRLADTNYIAAQRLDQARDAVAQARARLASQEAAVATAQARLAEAQYNLELTVIRAPVDGVIARRYAQPGAGASTLNVSTMFDLEPDAQRIVRAEIVEADIPNVTLGQAVEIQPEGDPTKTYVGQVLRRANVFGARRLQSDDPSQRSDERVVEVVVSADDAPLLIGQRVLVKFMKPGQRAGAARPVSRGVGPDQSMQPANR
ncbi:efflux RND transporter periplasmic adaptor subunit [Brevundimonas sp. 2R-24]|uniref:Efflux RND transporter periplasmic adaptor subunit n=1 Tax=Peiella sedimenti TaxID=3061083 RepID=A0ABT8SLL2_9CAUL|nr:efflux RND transporter periplasmic adaptor subunit [Caulobacteraceae bacterium XZ-24]